MYWAIHSGKLCSLKKKKFAVFSFKNFGSVLSSFLCCFKNKEILSSQKNFEIPTWNQYDKTFYSNNYFCN